MMTPSPWCIDFIKGFEKCRLTAYLPTPNDVPTIGWGSTGPDIKLGMTWTQKQADARFAEDLRRFAGVVDALTSDSLTSQNQFDAMVSLAYNVGIKAFINSTLLKQHNALDFTAAAAEFLKWNRQAGVVLKGLTRRREAERRRYEKESVR